MRVNISISAKTKPDVKKFKWYIAGKAIKISTDAIDLKLKKGEGFGLRQIYGKWYVLDKSDMSEQHQISKEDYITLRDGSFRDTDEKTKKRISKDPGLSQYYEDNFFEDESKQQLTAELDKYAKKNGLKKLKPVKGQSLTVKYEDKDGNRYFAKFEGSGNDKRVELIDARTKYVSPRPGASVEADRPPVHVINIHEIKEE